VNQQVNPSGTSLSVTHALAKVPQHEQLVEAQTCSQ